MDIQITGRNVTVNEGLKSYVDGRLGPVLAGYPRIENAHAILSHEKYRFTAEVVVQGRDKLREVAQETTNDLYAAIDAAVSALAACPLFVGFWALAQAFGSETPFVFIAAVTVLLGGLSWDYARFLGADMLAQADTTHAIVFGTLGNPLGSAFPLPGTWSGYLFSSSLPRFLPYLAGKVPAIVGAVTIAEIVVSFPGLGSTLLDALLATNTDLLVASVFILLCLNAVVTFAVKTVLFLVYPRWYEKSV